MIGGCLLPIIAVVLGFNSLLAIGIQRLSLMGFNIPQTYPELRRREFWYTFAGFLCLYLSWIGIAVLVLIYLTALYKHLRSRSVIDAAPQRHPILPRASLAELLLMMLSLGAFPAIATQIGVQFGTIEMQQVGGAAMIFGFVLFPIFFVCALYRLQARDIPHTWRRYLVLCLYPYGMFGCQLTASAILFGIFIARDIKYWPPMIAICATPIALLIVAVRLCLRHAESSIERESRPEAEIAATPRE